MATLPSVKIGGTDFEDVYGLYLANYTYTPPETKTEYQSVPGRTGDLDFTEALSGAVHYHNAKISLNFKHKSMRTFLASAAMDAVLSLHGTRQTVVFTGGALENKSFSGRLTLGNIQSAKYSGYLTISVIVDAPGTAAPSRDLIGKNITANGSYYAANDDANGYYYVNVNMPTIPKTVYQNGTYQASADGAAGYSSVVVDVSVAPGDETVYGTMLDEINGEII